MTTGLQLAAMLPSRWGLVLMAVSAWLVADGQRVLRRLGKSHHGEDDLVPGYGPSEAILPEMIPPPVPSKETLPPMITGTPMKGAPLPPIVLAPPTKAPKVEAKVVTEYAAPPEPKKSKKSHGGHHGGHGGKRKKKHAQEAPPPPIVIVMPKKHVRSEIPPPPLKSKHHGHGHHPHANGPHANGPYDNGPYGSGPYDDGPHGYGPHGYGGMEDGFTGHGGWQGSHGGPEYEIPPYAPMDHEPGLFGGMAGPSAYGHHGLGAPQMAPVIPANPWVPVGHGGAHHTATAEPVGHIPFHDSGYRVVSKAHDPWV